MEQRGMERGMNKMNTGTGLPLPLLRAGAAMGRAIVDDPKQPFTRPIGFLSQHLLDQPAKGCNTSRQLTPAHDISPADVPGSQILQGSSALVFVLDIGRSARRGRQRGRATAAGLEAGLLVGTENVVLGPQEFALPQARIKVQNRASLVGKMGITRKK